MHLLGMTVLLTTADPCIAILIGQDPPCDPFVDGAGFQLSGELNTEVGPCALFQGPDGEVEIIGERAIDLVVEALTRLLKRSDRLRSWSL